MELQHSKIVEALHNVKAPAARTDIIDSKMVQKIEVSAHSVSIDLATSEPNPTVEKSLRYQIEKAILAVEPEAQIQVNFIQVDTKSENLNQIATMIAVGSGKGGVGKSSITVNLAKSFLNLGYKVGILDCDIYGPSIPTMLGVADKKPMMLNGKVQPIETHGLKVMSSGFFVEPGQGVIWRGPMIHKLIQQFFADVQWGELDILIIDLPPGTGDAPLSLAQTIPLTGAVMVSMPQAISLIDVHKGISMFNQVKVPILGVIENMSHFVCPSCSHEENIFDRGGVKHFCLELGVAYLGDVPIEPKLRALSDEGRPFVSEYPDSAAAKAIEQIASRLTPFIKTTEDAEEQIKISV